jgi:hypothetical protein
VCHLNCMARGANAIQREKREFRSVGDALDAA